MDLPGTTTPKKFLKDLTFARLEINKIYTILAVTNSHFGKINRNKELLEIKLLQRLFNPV
jgi:hypothetical protein